MGAVYTQIEAKQDRLNPKGLDSAVDSFLRAAGTFRYIYENFTNAPSMDLGPDMLDMLSQLMLVLWVFAHQPMLFSSLHFLFHSRLGGPISFTGSKFLRHSPVTQPGPHRGVHVKNRMYHNLQVSDIPRPTSVAVYTRLPKTISHMWKNLQKCTLA